MSQDYKNIFFIVFAVISLILLSGFQIGMVNHFSWGFNIFLVLVLFLILTKHTYAAIFLAWLGGFLIDTAHFSVFGVTRLFLLMLTFFLIIFQKKALVTAKNEGILIMSVSGVILFRFLEWIMNTTLTGGQEKFSFYFFNPAIAVELLLSTVLLVIVFKYRVGQHV